MSLTESKKYPAFDDRISVQYAISEELRSLYQVPVSDQILKWSTHVLGRLRAFEGEVTFRLVTVEEMQGLNKQYRAKDKPTNVLSFPFDEQDLPLKILGDIVLCAPVIQQEAQEQNKKNNAHWAHMVVHGLLHLLHYDHQESYAANEMEHLETEMMRELGFPPPYEDS